MRPLPPAGPKVPPPLRIGNFSGFYGDRFDALHEMLAGGELDVLTGDYLAELTMLILGRDRLRESDLGYARTFPRQLEQCLGLAHERGVRIVTNAGGVNPAALAARIRELADRLGIPARVAHVTGDDVMAMGHQGGFAGDDSGGGNGTEGGRAGDDEPGGGHAGSGSDGGSGGGSGGGEAGDRAPGGARPRGPGREPGPGAGWGAGVVTANAYLGGHGIAACLRAGADIVVTGRVTDAALVTGPAAAYFDWRPHDPATYDRLAGAVVAGHILECGAQATGGNYAFFDADGTLATAPGASGAPGTRGAPRAPGAPAAHAARHPGFPIAELHADGSCVITKHPGTGGRVDVGTVTAQLLYETAGARYPGPDVTARLDTVRLTAQGPDRVRVDGVRGEPPPPTLKVGLNRLGGFRGEVVFVLTGLDIEAKAALVRAQMTDALAPRPPADVRWELARTDHADADTEEAASALLRLVARDADEDAVGRRLGRAAVELALASYPGFHVTAPPGKGTPYGVFETAHVDQAAVRHVAELPDGRRLPVPPPERTERLRPAPQPRVPEPTGAEPTRSAPLGLVAGARSGDKGGDANIGVWARVTDADADAGADADGRGDEGDGQARADALWHWLVDTLTVDRLRALLPECAECTVVRHVLPNLRALNFVVEGLLGAGVAARHRFDPQAKALGEWLRARHVDIPVRFLPAPANSSGAPARPSDAAARTPGASPGPSNDVLEDPA